MFNDKLQPLYKSSNDELDDSEKKKLFEGICDAARKNAKNKLSKIKQEYGTLDIKYGINGHDETPASFLAQEREYPALRVLLKQHVDTYWIIRRCIETKRDAGIKFFLKENIVSINLPASLYAEQGNDEKIKILRLCGANLNWITWGYAVDDNSQLVEKSLVEGASSRWACDGYATGSHRERVDELFSAVKDDYKNLIHLQKRAVRGAAEAGDNQQVEELLAKEPEGDDHPLRVWAIYGYATAGDTDAVDELLAMTDEPVLSDRLHKQAIRGYAKGGHHDLLPAQIKIDECNQAMQGYAEGGYPINAENMFNSLCGLEPAKKAVFLSDLLRASATGGHYAQTADFFERYSREEDSAYLIAHAYAEEGHIVEFKRWIAEQELMADQIKYEYRQLIPPIAGGEKITVDSVSSGLLLDWHFSTEPPIDRALGLLMLKAGTGGKFARLFNSGYQEIKKICKQANKNRQHFSMKQLCTEITKVLPQLDKSSELAQCIRFLIAQSEKAAAPAVEPSFDQKSDTSEEETERVCYVEVPQPQPQKPAGKAAAPAVEPSFDQKSDTSEEETERVCYVEVPQPQPQKPAGKAAAPAVEPSFDQKSDTSEEETESVCYVEVPQYPKSSGVLSLFTQIQKPDFSDSKPIDDDEYTGVELRKPAQEAFSSEDESVLHP
jgi:hypothetical protein